MMTLVQEPTNDDHAVLFPIMENLYVAWYR